MRLLTSAKAAAHRVVFDQILDRLIGIERVSRIVLTRRSGDRVFHLSVI